MDIDMDKVPPWFVNIAKVVFPACLVWVIVTVYLDSRALNAAPRYTIGYVTETSYTVGPSSHSNARFTYTVKGRKYADSASGDVDEGCTRCLVKFAASDPENTEFFNHVCVPDSIEKAPPDGWTVPPFAVPDGVK